MKKYYLLLLFFVPLISIAQSNYKKSAMVDMNGDTIRGFINYKEWGQNPKEILFKNVLSDQPQKFSANEIKYF